MALPFIPPLSAANYAWHPTPLPNPNPNIWQRQACGIENLDGLEIPNRKGHNDFSIAVTSRFYDRNLTFHQLVKAFKKVWGDTHFRHPQIACGPPIWRDGQLFLTYHPPADEEEAKQWVDGTVKVELSPRSSMEVHSASEALRRHFALSDSSPQSSPPASIHVIAPVTSLNDNTANKAVTFLFNLNHIYFDGTGAYSLIGLVLSSLAAELTTAVTRTSDPSAETRIWHNSIQSLTPAFVSLLPPPPSRAAYDSAVQKALLDTLTSQGSWGLQTQGVKSGVARNEFLFLSAHETAAVKRAAKNAGFNITHLAHAAVFCDGLRTNPPAPLLPVEDEAVPEPFIASYFALDDRQFISEKYPQHRKEYLANCHGHGNVRVENIRDCMLRERASRDEIYWVLVRMAMQIKVCYEECVRREGRVEAGMAVLEWLAGMVASGPKLESPITTPLLVSDGVYDRWIPPEVADPKTNEPCFTNMDVRLYANNYQTFPSFHIAAFRGRCILSVQYDDGFYPQGEMIDYLKSVRDMMLSFAGLKGEERSML